MKKHLMVFMLFATLGGCMPPTGSEHEVGFDFVKSLEAKGEIKRHIHKEGAHFRYMYFAVLKSVFGPNRICLNIYVDKPLSSYQPIVKECLDEKIRIGLKEVVEIDVLEGDLNHSKKLFEKTIK